MKQKFFSILPLLLFTATLVNAQFVEATTYRGAFAPAPTAMWTENWTNWDPQNAFYAAPTVNVNTRITTNTTWTKNNVYLLQGIIFVDSLITLTIEAGTVIRGDQATIISSLVISRGATIIANGTPCNPIVFTSSRGIGARVKGDWGGLTILGRGNTNQGNHVPIEGIASTNPLISDGRYGGTNNADNSGSLRYVRIEYAGYAIAPDNELNSLTFGGVGSGTTVDYVQTSFGNDDAFEWFGGAVNCKHLVAYRTLDDDFDTDFGYSGIVQFALSVKDPNVADNNTTSTSEGFESDNQNPGPFTSLPKTSATFYNVTQIGAFRCSSNAGSVAIPLASPAAFRRGARLRRNTSLKIFNSILMNNWRGLVMDADVIANAATPGGAAFQNNIIAMDTTIVFPAPYAGLALNSENVTTTPYLYAAANRNTIVNTPCDVLVNAWDFLNPDYRPNGAGTGAALAGCDLTPGINLGNAIFANTTPRSLTVDIFENGIGNSNGTVTLTIFVPSAFTVTALSNPGWTFTTSGNNVIATTNPGVVLAQNVGATLAFTINRKTGVGAAVQNLSVGLSGGADIDSNNDGALISVTAQ